MISLSGCQYDPYAESYTVNKPSVEMVTGTYVFEKQTIFTGDWDSDFTLKLQSDGTFNAVNIMNYGGDDFYFPEAPVSGAWKIEDVGSVDTGGSQLKTHWGIKLANMPTELQYIGLMGAKPPYKLIVTYGDPDAGEVMILRKK